MLQKGFEKKFLAPALRSREQHNDLVIAKNAKQEFRDTEGLFSLSSCGATSSISHSERRLVSAMKLRSTCARARAHGPEGTDTERRDRGIEREREYLRLLPPFIFNAD